MKKLVMVAMLAGSMLAMAADEAAPKIEPKPAPKAVVAPRPMRPGVTDEQRAKMREMFEKRRAEMKARAIAVIKKYGLDDAKANELFDELQGAMRPQRRPQKMPAPKPVQKPADPAK